MVAGLSMFVFFLSSTIVLATLAQRSTSEFVFKTLIHDVSGWSNPFVCWGIEMILPAVMFSGESGRSKKPKVVNINFEIS